MVVRGRGRGLVINTGDRTLMGRIAKLAEQTEQVDTPIAKEIKAFVFKVSTLAITIGIAFFIVGWIRGKKFVENMILLIGIIVANVPEGLLATVTVSLTLTAQRMSKKNVLVKNLEAVETLGSTSCICSDKTGTLTMNRMTVAHIYYDLRVKEVDTADPTQGEFDCQDYSFTQLLRIASLCNNAKFKKDGTITGDASETALLKFANPHLHDDIAGFRDRFPFLHGIPFNSSNKWQVSIH
eukprot:61843_1